MCVSFIGHQTCCVVHCCHPVCNFCFHEAVLVKALFIPLNLLLEKLILVFFFFFLLVWRPEDLGSTAQEIVLPAFMNPYGTPDPCSGADSCSRPPLPPYSPYGDPSHEPSLSATSSSLVPTGHSCMSVVSFAPFQVSPGPTLIPSPDHSTSVLPGAEPSLSLRSGQSNMVPQRSPGQTLSPVPLSTPNPYPAPSYQVSVIIPSPDLHLSPLQSRCLENTSPDLECSICFSQFNNVFRCPKMLQCKHTFCLECLARINVKSAQPGTIQCPLCRGVTTLPALGLPTLATDVSVLTYLPAAMQRVYSVRFLRSKGRLQVKRYGCKITFFTTGREL